MSTCARAALAILASMALPIALARGRRRPSSPRTRAPAAVALPPLPDDRAWLLCLDLRAIGRSGLAPLLERIDNAPQTQYLEDIGHLQVSRDISSVVVSGTYAPDSGVAYCAGTFDVDALHDLVEKIPDHAERTWHGHRIDSWQGASDPKPSWACVVNDHLLLFGRAEVQLDRALDALDGSATALSASAPLLAALPASAGALACGAAVDLDQLPAARKHSLVMKRILSLGLVVRQTGGDLQLELTGTTTSEAVAKRLARLVGGLQALAQLSVEDTPAHPLMALMVDHAVVASAGANLLVTDSFTPAEVFAALAPRTTPWGAAPGRARDARRRHRGPGRQRRRRAPVMAAVAASGAGGLALAEQHRLAEARRAGDPAAFGEPGRRLAPGLHRYLVATGTGASDADDLVQDAFMRAHRALADFDRRYAFTTWLYTIAHRLRLNRRARVDRQVALGAIPEPAAPEPAAPEAVGALGDERASTPMWDLARELLPERQMHALWLRYGEDMDIGAIARVLGTNALNIRVMLHRARTRLARAAPQDLRQNEGSP